jgi:hypothetical protein
MWNKWNSCSVSCGGGVRIRTRSCTNPKPGIHGKSCVGDPVQQDTCNNTDCRKLLLVSTHELYVLSHTLIMCHI